jgi:hypothetical protein
MSFLFRFRIAPISCLCLLLGLAACNLEQDITIKLPESEPQLVVEAYLEPGKPYRLLLTESVPFLSAPQLPLVNDATVIISHNGRDISLSFRPVIDSSSQKGFNYSSPEIFQPTVGDEIRLSITDSKGRTATAITRYMEPPSFEDIRVTTRASDSLSFLFFRFPDNNPNGENFYRLMVGKEVDSIADRPELDLTFEGRFTTDGFVTIGTSYRFELGDTLNITLFHVEKEYYDFVNTLRDAANANGNPFAQPAVIKSNINGGRGIFTTLSFVRRRISIRPNQALVLTD